MSAPSDRYECGVCWTVYDPAAGDPATDTPAGTPFEALSEDWRCPHCDGPKERYLRLPPEGPA